MAEYIEREALTCADCIHYHVCKDTWADENWNEDTPKEVKEMYSPKGCENFKPAADVVEVVRCKDCKHKGWIQEPCHGKSIDFCRVWDTPINRPDKCFCYYGERKGAKMDGKDE